MVTDIKKLQSGAMIRAKDELLTDDLAKKLGYSFALWLSERLGIAPDMLAISVGHDSRPSGPRLARAVIHGLTQADA
ncbi:MAG: phosphomannomutase/phosphoglucomutase, partial [Clostridia bacterium]|nr:phosphomannomutase/phosphoglucomutase [Clostridia bacterium]